MKPALFSFVILTVFFIFVRTAYASSATDSAHTNNNSSIISSSQNPDVPQNLHTLTQSVTIEVLSSIICQIAGVDPIDQKNGCLGVDPATGKIGYAKPSANPNQPKGLIGFVINMITMTYNLPVSTHGYVAYLSSNFGLAKPAYAQCSTAGCGYDSLQPLLDLWRVFRNMAYLLFVFFTIIIGLGIMLRIQVDPRTVMTIQNQIPKIIIAILLVTLSYAIAGFLIDMMWVTTYLGITLLATADPNVAIIKTLIQGQTPFGVVNGAFGFLDLPYRSSTALISAISGMMAGSGGAATGLTVIGVIGSAASFLTNTIAANAIFPGFGPVIAALGKLLSGIIGPVMGNNIPTNPLTASATIIAFLIILIAILIALARLWFQLIKSYIFILIDVVLAPFWIMVGVIPGSGIGFGTWMRDMLGNLAAFPVAVLMFAFGRVLIDSVSTSSTNQFVPPLIGSIKDIPAFQSLFGLGIILMTPEVVNMTRNIFKSPTFKYTAAIGAGFVAGAAPVQAGSSYSWWRLTRPRNIQTGAPAGYLRTIAIGPSTTSKPHWFHRFGRAVLGEPPATPPPKNP